MKILLLAATDGGGGAAIAATRLCAALNDDDELTAHLYVGYKITNGDNIYQLPRKKAYPIHRLGLSLEHKAIRFLHRSTNKILHSISLASLSDVSWINDSDYDIVHLHWINECISLADIAKITKPLVWTMHDSWPCCGAEHHPNVLEDDRRWQEGYFSNNKPHSTKGLDICRWAWLAKRHFLADKNIIFIAPSRWEHDVLKSSYLFRQNACYVIANILPYEVFYQRNVAKAKKLLNIASDKCVIGFGAAAMVDNPNSTKGTHYLLEAMKLLKNRERYFIVLFGPTSSRFTDLIDLPYYVAGFVSSPERLSILYSSCDCFVNSSLIENLSYTAYESIACQTPVVAFDVGGIKDIVIHKENGYLAKPYETEDLAKGIAYCCQYKDVLSRNCLKIKAKYSKDNIVQQHKQVYEMTCQKRGG